MKPTLKKLTVALAIFVAGALLTATASAECAIQPKAHVKNQSWQGGRTFFPNLILADFNPEPIVGMWHVVFTGQGNTGESAMFNNATVDNALVTWHADGTEIMNSGRPPQDGNFCMGIWEQVGRFHYRLNHFALGNAPNNAPSGIGDPSGPTQITEDVYLSPDCNHYTGYFTLDAVDPSGNPTTHIVGVISGTRINLNTTIKNLL